VIASRCPTVAEIAGTAAVFCEATDADAFSSAMSRVAADERLRADLRARGRERARGFSWRRCAAETFAVYQQLL
jgi:alpha-1,3-rhamnosyl/mannosyltransferase